ENLHRILRTDRDLRVILIGVGNLGTALVSYGGFNRQGYKITMAFDADRRKVGSARRDLAVHHIDSLEDQIKDSGADIAILAVQHIDSTDEQINGCGAEIAMIAVRADAGQAIADRLVKAGSRGILSSVPRRLSVPARVKVHCVDLSIEMEALSYYLRTQDEEY